MRYELTHITNYNKAFTIFQLCLRLSIKNCLWRPSHSQTIKVIKPVQKLKIISLVQANYTPQRGDGLLNRIDGPIQPYVKTYFCTSVCIQPASAH
jgi:hypothetical protein